MKVLRSFRYAWSGIAYCFRSQQNFRIHVFLLILVSIAGILFKISAEEWLIILVCAMLVLVLEMINTAIEFLCDIVTKDLHPLIKIIKDVAAGAVLISAAGSAIVGLIIFLPKIFALLN